MIIITIVDKLKGEDFIFATNFEVRSGQIALFNMQVVFVFPFVYDFATLESGKDTFVSFAKWSGLANGRLCSAMKPENLTSANRASFSESESFLE